MIQNPIEFMEREHLSQFGRKHPKTMRGWTPIYEIIFNTIGNEIDVITEIGIGNATCQIAWSKTFPGKRVVGIDVASPSIELCKENNNDVRQFENAMSSISNMHRLSMKEIVNIDLYYNKNAYEKSVADQYLELYGKQVFFINDGKQDGLAHRKFRETWEPMLLPGGLLLQERIARKGTQGIRIHQMVKAVREGWLVYDCREYVQFEDPNCNGFMGIWTSDPDKWTHLLKDFKRVTDPESQIDLKYQIPDDDNILQ